MQKYFQARLLAVSSASLFTLLAVGTPMAGAQSTFDLIHPSTSVSYSAAFGDKTIEQVELAVNGGSVVGANSSADSSALFHRIRGEHFFASQFGVFGQFEVGNADSFDGELSGLDVESRFLFLGVSYRATLGDTFRMPVRIGPYAQQTNIDVSGNDFDYAGLGLMLSAEPEYALMQRLNGNRVSELSLYADISVGTSKSEVEFPGGLSEEGHAFRFSVDIGTRYKFESGLMLGLSILASKNNYGLTDSFDQAGLPGIDDDFTGIALTVGWRG